MSNTYNCMGMIFASRRTWIQPEHLEMILEEDGYRQLDHPDELEQGDLVVYRDNGGNATHIGVVAAMTLFGNDRRREITILSQWGQAGEYLHMIQDVNPWLGTPSEYWTDRTT